eukprot:UN23637
MIFFAKHYFSQYLLKFRIFYIKNGLFYHVFKCRFCSFTKVTGMTLREHLLAARIIIISIIIIIIILCYECSSACAKKWRVGARYVLIFVWLIVNLYYKVTAMFKSHY